MEGGQLNEKELKTALLIAAEALDIASDWNVRDVQVYPPSEWGLESYGENAADGWCSTRQLAKKLRQLAGENGTS